MHSIVNICHQLAHEDGTVPDTSVAGVIMAQQEYDRSVVILLLLVIIIIIMI